MYCTQDYLSIPRKTTLSWVTMCIYLPALLTLPPAEMRRDRERDKKRKRDRESEREREGGGGGGEGGGERERE